MADETEFDNGEFDDVERGAGESNDAELDGKPSEDQESEEKAPEGLELHPGPVPLFPLPKMFLAPNTLVPLHIFEPRYRQMIDDLLDSRGELILGTVPHHCSPRVLERGGEDTTPVLPIGGLGRLHSFERLADGRYIVVILGVRRVILREVPRDRLYRQALVEPLDDIPPSAAAGPLLRQRLESALRARGGENLQLSEELTVGHLADMLSLQLDIPVADMERIFACPDAARRAQFVLEIADRG